MTYRDQGGPSTGPYADFRAAVKAFVQARDENRKLLAAMMECAQSTVDRWWMGTATPHPLLQAKVLAWISAHKSAAG